MLHKHEIGVCVDEAVAYLLEEKNDENLITIIKADDIEEPENTVEAGTHQRKDHVYYKKVFDMIQDFDKVSLFGPAKSRNEIVRRIRAKKLNHILVQTNNSEDNVTENQKIDFINSYFQSKP